MKIWGQVIPLNDYDTTSIQVLPELDIDIDAGVVTPPRSVMASDGAFPDRIKVVWEASHPDALYKVYRSLTPDRTSLIEVSNGWKRSNWMLDYKNLESEQRYYYCVVAALNSRQISTYSITDIGYLKITDVMAIPNKEKEGSNY